MDNERLERARAFNESTQCLMRGHIMSIRHQQDEKYLEAMAAFAQAEANRIADALDAIPRGDDAATKLDYELRRFSDNLRGEK